MSSVHKKRCAAREVSYGAVAALDGVDVKGYEDGFAALAQVIENGSKQLARSFSRLFVEFVHVTSEIISIDKLEGSNRVALTFLISESHTIFPLCSVMYCACTALH
jgi:hypothetical protein